MSVHARSLAATAAAVLCVALAGGCSKGGGEDAGASQPGPSGERLFFLGYPKADQGPASARS
jgi:hypothetical protein